MFRFLLCAILAAVSCLLQFYFFISPILFLYSCNFVRLFFFSICISFLLLFPSATQSIARAPFNVTKHSPTTTTSHTASKNSQWQFSLQLFQWLCSASNRTRRGARSSRFLQMNAAAAVEARVDRKRELQSEMNSTCCIAAVEGSESSGKGRDETLVYEENCNNT